MVPAFKSLWIKNEEPHSEVRLVQKWKFFNKLENVQLPNLLVLGWFQFRFFNSLISQFSKKKI